MIAVPKQIGGASVVLFTLIDGRNRHTGTCRQLVAGVLQTPAAALAICQYHGENSFYLFACDEHWSSITDTRHQTIEEAMRQAEFEYEGVSATWQRPA
jgi:hypothetical protein